VLSAVDSFIQWLSTELAGDPPVHWVRVSPLDSSNIPKLGYLNVAVLGFLQNGSLEEALVSLDLIGSDERTVIAWAQKVRDKLIERQYTPELVYAVTPATPTPTGKTIAWEGAKVDFKIVGTSDNFVHLNATFPICHARQ
jgi:hypothetical protein